MIFTVDFDIAQTIHPDGAITVSGRAMCEGRKYSSGASATADKVRGGVTAESLRIKVGKNLMGLIVKNVEAI